MTRYQPKRIVCLFLMSVIVIVGLASRFIKSNPGRADARVSDVEISKKAPFVTSLASSSDRDNANKQREGIKIAMSAAFVAESGIAVYDRIAQHLADRTGLPCQLVTGFSYKVIDAMLDNGTVDLAFVCGLPYVLKREDPNPTVELLAAPVMKAALYNDAPKYYSYVIVHKTSRATDFSDLAGCTFGYNDELSNSGYNMPRARLIELGETSGFFGRLVRSGSHEESIRLVAEGKVDASAVDSLVLDYELARDLPYARAVKIIDTIGPAGIPPVVASTKLSIAVRKGIQNALIGMKDDPDGRHILKQALIDRFELVDDANYDDIRRMVKLAKDAGFLELK